MKIIAKTRKDTADTAKIFLDKILEKKYPARATVVGLSGNLGAGKTAFVKAIAKHLGIKATVNSPTFVLIKKYSLPHANFKFMFHIDAYRLKHEKELKYLGWDEIIADPRHLVFIEWPEQVIAVMPKHSRYIHIAHEKGRHRSLKLS
ncbi:MAG: tRNA (adenosine(37)-N6)-threonylcarbamoyltransferase complex ATPase subunit type 1 TsaE [bacterium]|nr:tRNA (adenosine(37)-N6)-threonylcarbamoyltransferase complex ATPase subunit type 1 TsaE [bacterium]